MTDSETTKKQKEEMMSEIREMSAQITSGILPKLHYQDMRHVRNSMRKMFREAEK